MTLTRQLLGGLTLILALLFAGSFTISVDNTRRFLATQLETHSQDTATTLGMTLSMHMPAGDVLLIESIVDAVFDGGYYREIVVAGVDGKPLVTRVSPITVSGVPDWFVDALPLLTPRTEAHVMSGWRRGGTVYVASHPGHAYRQLWANAVEFAVWSLSAWLGAIGLALLGLRFVLGPLAALEKQALAISVSNFSELGSVPRTRELRRIVLAMNGMARKLERMLLDMSERLAQLRAQAFTDALTGLGNRRAFERDLAALVERREEYPFGVGFLVKVHGLKDANADGFDRGNLSICGWSARLECAAGDRDVRLSRLGGGLFAGVAVDTTREDGGALAERIVRAFAGPDGARVHVGLAWFAGHGSAKEFERGLNDALDAAESGAPRASAWRLADDAPDLAGEGAPDAAAWESHLRSVLEAGRVSLAFQPVRSAADDGEIHHEVLVRVPDRDGVEAPASAFLAFAKRAGLAVPIDEAVLDAAAQVLSGRRPGPPRIAINLSPASLRDPDFLTRIEAWLCRHRAHLPRVDIEISAYGIARCPDGAARLARAVHGAGGRLGVDHFGTGDVDMTQVRTLQLDYLKVDGSCVRDVDTDAAVGTLIQGWVDVGRGADVEVIAEMVETESERAALIALGVDGLQGYLVGRPHGWPPAHRDRYE